MDLKDIIMDSFKYSTSDWVKVIVLGLVIFIADMVDETSYFHGLADEINILLIIIATILAIFEIGYMFRIIEDTTHGSQTMPPFNMIRGTFFHGIKEAMITVLYFIIPFILILVGIIQIDERINFINSIMDEFRLIFIMVGLFLASLLYLPFQAAILNMADHHGTIRSGIDLKKIYIKMRKMGIKNMVFIYILTVLFALVLRHVLSDSIGIIPFRVGDILSGLIIAPFILIFTSRALGLINKTLD